MPRHLIGDEAWMDQRDSHCPYSLSSETTAKPTVLGVLVCQCGFDLPLGFFLRSWRFLVNLTVSQYYTLWVVVWAFEYTKLASVNGIFLELVCWWPFFFLFVQQRGKKTLLSLTLICHCHLVGMAKIVRGSTLRVRPWNTATWRFGWLTVSLWYCITLSLFGNRSIRIYILWLRALDWVWQSTLAFQRTGARYGFWMSFCLGMRLVLCVILGRRRL